MKLFGLAYFTQHNFLLIHPGYWVYQLVHSFLSLRNSPQYRDTTACVTIQPPKDIWLFPVFGYGEWSCYKHSWTGYGVHMSSFLWYKCQGVQLLGLMRVAYLVFQETAIFPEWLYHFTFPPGMYEWYNFSTSLLAFGVVSFLF